MRQDSEVFREQRRGIAEAHATQAAASPPPGDKLGQCSAPLGMPALQRPSYLSINGMHFYTAAPPLHRIGRYVLSLWGGGRLHRLNHATLLPFQDSFKCLRLVPLCDG